jgi:serine acetyltransferase
VALLRRGEQGDKRAWTTFSDGIREDHRMLSHYAERYDAREQAGGESTPSSAKGPVQRAETPRSLLSDAVTKIGFQLMIAYRAMRFFRQAGFGLGAQFMSRAIRHAFASDVHWDAELEPGVVVVHGFGLAVSYAAKVRTGCILFQNVTLGYGTDAVSARAGAPLLESNVHVGIGATLYGPIVVGESTKIMAGCVLRESVPARSIVEAPVPHVVPRAAARTAKSRV